MKPSELSYILRQIANKIDNSKSPSISLVNHELNCVVAAMQDYELIQMQIVYPDTMLVDEAIKRAKKLIPCKTDRFEEIESSIGLLIGNMECEPGFYAKNEDGDEYGPDEAGVVVSWETP